MDTKIKLNNDMKEAMRSKNQVAKRTLMMVRAAIQQTEKDRREELDESAILAILQKELKSREETISEAKKAGRDDLLADTEDEIVILKKYLPVAMSAEALHTIAVEVVAELEASTIRDMGKVMKVIIPRVAGRASGGDISKTVRDLLQS